MPYDFDAHSVESHIKDILQLGGTFRGGPYDADNLRDGKREDLGEILRLVGEKIGVRSFALKDKIGFESSSTVLGYLSVSLRHLGSEIKAMGGKEPEDYHWEVIGNLIGTVAVLMDYAEKS